MRCYRLALWLTFCSFAYACGGGGGDGDGGGGGSASGAFMLGSTSATFRAGRGHEVPAAVRIPFTVTGGGVAAVGAAFRAGQQATWLDVGITGSLPNFTLELRPNTTGLDLGTHSATLLVGTADASGTVLQSREIQISYSVFDGIQLVAAPASANFVFGAVTTSQPLRVTVTAAGRSWNLTSDAPWLSVPGGAQQGSATLDLTLDASALSLGGHGATLTAQNTADPVDVRRLTVIANVFAPTLGLSDTPLLIGGADGLGDLSKNLSISLNTGTNAYPWTLTLSDPQNLGILVSPVTSGTVSDTGSAVAISADTETIVPGSYEATAHFDVLVRGETLRTSVPVTVRWDAQRIVASSQGLGFSSFPGRPAAVQALAIRHSHREAGIEWSARPLAEWLDVSPATGATGDTLSIAINDFADELQTDQLHLGTIEIGSSDPRIRQGETIRVALWKGSTLPSAISLALPARSASIVMNPSEPWVYLHTGGTDILAYNVHTGAPVPGFSATAVVTTAGPITISADGRLLYVTDMSTPRTVALDAATGQLHATYTPTANSTAPTDDRFGIAYGRPNGRPMVWTAYDEPVDVETGTRLPVFASGAQSFGTTDPFRTWSPDGLYFFHGNLSHVRRDQHRYTELGGASLQLEPQTVGDLTPTGGLDDYCLTSNELRVVVATLGPNPIRIYPTDLLGAPQEIPLNASSVTCALDGRIYVGVNTFTSEDNVHVFDEMGTSIGRFRHGALGLIFNVRQMRLSGDQTRLVWPSMNAGDGTLEITSVP